MGWEAAELEHLCPRVRGFCLCRGLHARDSIFRAHRLDAPPIAAL